MELNCLDIRIYNSIQHIQSTLDTSNFRDWVKYVELSVVRGIKFMR